MQMIEDGEDVNRRDHVGRTPLHVAIISKSVECANILIDAGARMSARLVGGRTSLHLVAQTDQTGLVKKMLERSAYNEAKSAEEKLKAEEAEESPEVTERVRMSSEDDWSSESDDGKPPQKAPVKSDTEKDFDPLEDDKETPGILDISNPDWDFGITPLGYAILSGCLEVVDVLLVAGADPNHATRAKDADPLHPLTLTIYIQDEERAARIAERLVAAQAISSTADKNLLTIFHRMVVAGKTITHFLSSGAMSHTVLQFNNAFPEHVVQWSVNNQIMHTLNINTSRSFSPPTAVLPTLVFEPSLRLHPWVIVLVHLTPVTFTTQSLWSVRPVHL